MKCYNILFMRQFNCDYLNFIEKKKKLFLLTFKPFSTKTEKQIQNNKSDKFPVHMDTVGTQTRTQYFMYICI